MWRNVNLLIASMFWIALVLTLPTSISAIGQPHYECGEHGRFEYCIDGIPGCIVGCHCHPGYYFDTESKICEPNAKLVEEYRRVFSVASPTRVPSNLLELEPTPITTNPMDVHVENIAKESDDLGDWLYNQFFKTIESQVINNTDPNASDKPPTRRSGGGPMNIKKPKRGKNGKKNSKKNKKKKTDLRRKLLRITEDDSLFDSSSGSSEESSESDSSSNDSSSDTSSEHDDKDTNKHDDKEHGHRKILVINKKPKPPLPSFIFLPHLDTPFFPPIALPPPAIPMFPMVPVPPMPIYPYPPVTPPCSPHMTSTTKTPDTKPDDSKKDDDKKPEENSKKPDEDKGKEDANKKHEDEGKQVEEKKPEEKKLPDDKPTEDKKPEDKKPEETKPEETKPEETKPDETKSENSTDKNNTLRFFRSDKQGQRKKFLRKIQQRLKSSNNPGFPKKMKRKLKQKIPIFDMMDYDSPFLDNHFPDGPVQPATPINDPPPEDVDFKYLAQLIHKMDNKTSNNPNNVQPANPNAPMRRFGSVPAHFYAMPQSVHQQQMTHDGNFKNRRQLESPDDSYYSNLGTQIATLIRKIDSTGDKRVNIEIDRTPTLQQPIVNENSYAPRSYWERSVRSLLNHLQPYEDEYYSLQNQEESLFNLERKVETLATTEKSLSLNELENVVFLMGKSKSGFHSTTEVPDTVTKRIDGSIKINLLPRLYEYPALQHKKYEYGYFKGPPPNLSNAKNSTEMINLFVNANNMQNDIIRTLMHNLRNVPKGKSNINVKKLPKLKDSRNVEFDKMAKHDYLNLPRFKSELMKERNMTILGKNEIANLQRMVGAKLNEVANSRNQLPSVPWLAPKLANMLTRNEIYRIPDFNARRPVNIQFQFNPRRHNYRTNRFYVNRNDRHFHSKNVVPIIKPTHLKPKPSYFHHELQHFDMYNK